MLRPGDLILPTGTYAPLRRELVTNKTWAPEDNPIVTYLSRTEIVNRGTKTQSAFGLVLCCTHLNQIGGNQLLVLCLGGIGWAWESDVEVASYATTG